MPIAAIHVAVEGLLDRPVSMESVSWSLRMGVKGEKGHFERVAYGVYGRRTALS